MKRYSPLKRKAELIRGAPLRNRGTKARRDAVEMKAAERHMGPKVCRAARLLDTPCIGGLRRHHILPRGHQGPNTPENLIWLCLGHHDWVHNQDPRRARELGLLR